MNLYDPEWIRALAEEMDLLDKNFTKEEFILVCDLFTDYYREGLTAREALEKAFIIVNQFRNKRIVGQAK